MLKEVQFEHKALIEKVTIYETYHPGSIVALYAFDYIKDKWINIWSIFSDNIYKTNLEAINRQMPPKSSRKFEPNLIRKDVFSDRLRVELEYTKLEYYSELDAIEISGVLFDINKLKTIAININKIANLFENQMEKITKPIANDVNNRSVQENSRQHNTLLRDEKRLVNTPIIKTCSNIVDLPKEILCLILSYLDLKAIFRLRSTCRTFYDACTFDYFYHKIDLQPYWHLVNNNLFN